MAIMPTVEMRFSTESDKICEAQDMHHIIPAKAHPKIEIEPEPVLSPFADLNVLSGTKMGPAVDPILIETYPTICIVCGVDFKLRNNLHAHLCSNIHIFGKLDTHLTVPVYECKHCLAEVNCSNVLKHRCFIKHQLDLSKTEATLDEVGSPLVCIFCRGRVLPSRSHLIAHLLLAHSTHRNPFRCIFCHSIFQSDSLIMQERHVFDIHVPELIFLNRLAYFKDLKSIQHALIDTTVPFLCLYEKKRMENVAWWETLGKNLIPSLKGKQEMADNSQDGGASNSMADQLLCSSTFSNLAEYTAHIYCQHTCIASSHDKERTLTDKKAKKVEKIHKRIPGPTIRQIMSGPPSGTTVNDVPRPTTTRSKHFNMPQQFGTVVQKATCKVCLQDYGDEYSLKNHLALYHIPECQKRVQHLISTGELSKILPIELLCTECFTLFPNVFKLQVHVVVAHGGNTWCACGFCGEEFSEPDRTLPAGLTIGKLSVGEEENQNSNPNPPTNDESFQDLLEQDTPYLPYASKLPVLTIYHLLKTHEAKHCVELRAPQRIPYLPVDLLQQIINSKGHQAAQLGQWLINAFSQAPHLFVKPFRYDNPNDPKKRRRILSLIPGKDPLSSEGMNFALEALQGLIDRNLKPSLSEWEDSQDESKAERKISLRSVDRPSVIATIGVPQSPKTIRDMNRLPGKLVKIFAKIGEKNAGTQAELEFAETL